MTALAATTGHQRWQQTALGSGQRIVQITIQPSLIWIVDEDISAFDPASGGVRWALSNLPQPAEVVMDERLLAGPIWTHLDPYAMSSLCPSFRRVTLVPVLAL